jgi:hypothetical protein
MQKNQQKALTVKRNDSAAMETGAALLFFVTVLKMYIY